MLSPMHSFGESNTQPKMPCSASGAWGGKRSTLARPGAAVFRGRLRFKSGRGPAVSVTESIIGQRNEIFWLSSIKTYFQLLAGCSPVEPVLSFEFEVEFKVRWPEGLESKVRRGLCSRLQGLFQ